MSLNIVTKLTKPQSKYIDQSWDCSRRARSLGMFATINQPEINNEITQSYLLLAFSDLAKV